MIVRPVDMLIIPRSSMVNAPWTTLRDDFREALEAVGRMFDRT
jgi:hypothetical protein